MAKFRVFKEITSWLITVIVIFTILFALNLIVFTISDVNQVSMNNTLVEDDIVFYNRLAVRTCNLSRGDIVLFLAGGREKQGLADEITIKFTDLKDAIKKSEQFSNMRYVKRIIGMPGDIIDIKIDGTVYINGEKESKPYVLGLTSPGNMDYPLQVPADSFFVMGDNREFSKDSRNFGCVSIHSLEGKAEYIIWPPLKVQSIK